MNTQFAVWALNVNSGLYWTTNLSSKKTYFSTIVSNNFVIFEKKLRKKLKTCKQKTFASLIKPCVLLQWNKQTAEFTAAEQINVLGVTIGRDILILLVLLHHIKWLNHPSVLLFSDNSTGTQRAVPLSHDLFYHWFGHLAYCICLAAMFSHEIAL